MSSSINNVETIDPVAVLTSSVCVHLIPLLIFRILHFVLPIGVFHRWVIFKQSIMSPRKRRQRVP